MDEITKAKEAWKDHLTNKIVRGQYYSAIENFQSALIEELEKEIDGKDLSIPYIMGISKAIELVKTTTPKT
jgi:hypothetical protein